MRRPGERKHRCSGLAGAWLLLAVVAGTAAGDDFRRHPSLAESDTRIRSFEFAGGEVLDELKLHVTSLGRPVRNDRGVVKNAVLILHGTTGHGQGFLSERFAGGLFGPGQLLDVGKYYVILPDGIGHGKSSRPSDGLHMRFPAYNYDDMVRAHYLLLTEHLGVDHLRLVMGTSMGGMHSWVWGSTYPDFMDALMPLASLPVEIAGRNRMMRKMILDSIRQDPSWQGGEYENQPRGLTAAVHALIFMVSSPLQWQKQAPTREAAEDFLRRRVERYAGALDANDLIYQFDASRDYNPSPHLHKIKAPLVAVNSADDQVNPPELGILEREIRKVPGGRAVVLPISDKTRGHGTHSLPAVWGRYLEQLLRETDPDAHPATEFVVQEATIADIHAAFEAGRLTARQLVERYLARIEAYDKQGPALNAIVTINPRALERADDLDAAFQRSGLTGPLHGIPVIVKDNYDTADLPTSAGSLSLARSLPPDDAFQVRQIRQAGAIVLAKSNMAEFAFSPYETVGSALPGYTRNPYALSRVTAGSSGGTAAAVAANFGTVGLGTDTGNSIRGPSSHNLLVGIRSTMGLTSRDGIVPLYLDHDIGGPMARTVADAVAVFDVIAGYDPADPVTAASQEHPERYADHLDPDGLKGARLGVVRQLADVETGDPEIQQRFEEALADLRAQGASVVDPVRIEELDTIPRDQRWCRRFQYDLNNYLKSLGPEAAVKSLEEVVESGDFHPSVARGLHFFRDFDGPPEEDESCRTAWANGKLLAAGVRKVLADSDLDALVYPTWSNPPRLIGDLNTPAGDNSQDLSPHTGFPAITVPMGLVGGGLPAGLQILGDAFSEPRLIELAYAYEQATRHRKPPSTTPMLVSEAQE